MRPLTFRCPRTDREIASGICAEPDALIRLFSLRLRCPACEDLHEWHVSEAALRIHKVAIQNPLENRLLSGRAMSSDVLHDLGLSDGEISAYFVRFSDIRVELAGDRRSGNEYHLRRLSEHIEHVELA
jgi:hypothetical protein